MVSNVLTNTSTIDQIFTLGSTRSDLWRDLLVKAKKWVKDEYPSEALQTQFARMQDLEILHAYPGRHLMQTLANYLKEEKREAFESLAGRISFSILARYYKDDAHEWEVNDDHVSNERYLEADNDMGDRPYFEVLIVAPTNSPRLERNIELLRRQRRKEDSFVYEPVLVESF